MKYVMQDSNPHSTPHNMQTWDRMKYHAGNIPRHYRNLVMWAGGHEKDAGNGEPFVKYCIKHGWIK